jgi:hypothetical protein
MHVSSMNATAQLVVSVISSDEGGHEDLGVKLQNRRSGLTSCARC